MQNHGIQRKCLTDIHYNFCNYCMSKHTILNWKYVSLLAVEIACIFGQNHWIVWYFFRSWLGSFDTKIRTAWYHVMLWVRLWLCRPTRCCYGRLALILIIARTSEPYLKPPYSEQPQQCCVVVAKQPEGFSPQSCIFAAFRFRCFPFKKVPSNFHSSNLRKCLQI